MRHSALILLAGLIATQPLLAEEKASQKPETPAVASYDKELAEIREAIEIQLKSRDPTSLSNVLSEPGGQMSTWWF